MTRAERIAIVRPVLRHFRGNAGRWTQWSLARTDKGRSIGPQEMHAVCWCLQGAACAVGVSPTDLAIALRLDNLAVWNDAVGRTFAQVQRKLKAACK